MDDVSPWTYGQRLRVDHKSTGGSKSAADKTLGGLIEDNQQAASFNRRQKRSRCEGHFTSQSLYAAPSCQDVSRRLLSANRCRYVGQDPRPTFCRSSPDRRLSCRGGKGGKGLPRGSDHSVSGCDGRFARPPARQGAALPQALCQALRGERTLSPLVGAHARGPEEADRGAGAAGAPPSDGLAHCDGVVSRRLGAATVARREARRHHGSRGSDAREEAGRQARPRAEPPRESLVDQVRRAAAK